MSFGSLAPPCSTHWTPRCPGQSTLLSAEDPQAALRAAEKPRVAPGWRCAQMLSAGSGGCPWPRKPTAAQSGFHHGHEGDLQGEKGGFGPALCSPLPFQTPENETQPQLPNPPSPHPVQALSGDSFMRGHSTLYLRQRPLAARILAGGGWD